MEDIIIDIICNIHTVFNTKLIFFFALLGLQSIGVDPLPIPDISIPYSLDKVEQNVLKIVFLV